MTSEDLTIEWIKCDSCSARAVWLARGTNGELTFCGHHLNKNKAGLDSWAYEIIELGKEELPKKRTRRKAVKNG
ncbi:MAG: hypothetical protein EBV71_08175 [Chitinophagia bacterium]|nr:hypothetical protein [Chitinophagia bacterium]